MSGPGPVGGEPVGSQRVAAPEAADVTPASSSASDAAAVTRRERRGTWLAVIGLVVMLIGSYAAAVALSGDDLPDGTDVAGVDIGGLSSDQAEDVLRSALVPRSRRPVDLVVGGRTFRFNPSAAGLSVDVDASVARAHGGSRLDPRRLWADLTSTVDPVAPVVRVDQDALISAMHRLARRVNRPAVEPWIGFESQRPVVHRGEPGLELDTAQAIVTLLDSWLVDRRAVHLPVQPRRPAVDAAAVREAVERQARPAMQRPVRLLIGRRTVHLRPGRYAPALRLEVRNGALAPVVNAQLLARRLPQGAVATGLRSPHDARVVLRSGRPTVLAARPGTRIRPHDAARALVAALTSRDRTARVAGTPLPARISTRDARGWGIREPVASTSVAYRNADLVPLVGMVNGFVLRPGRTFSLGGILGPRSADVADTDRLATALYGAGFAAGMRDVEHHAHPAYHAGLPRGLDATLSWPETGLRFAGTTPYGVLVQAWVSPGTEPGRAGGQLHVRLWSTRYWDVTSVTSDPFDLTPPGRTVSHHRGCEPHPGRPGFSIGVVRDLHHGSRELSTSSNTTYAPVDAVVCRPRR